MDTTFCELAAQSQHHYNGIKRKIQFFNTFAGAVIEALRENGFRLCNIEKEVLAPVGFDPRPRVGNNLSLSFEQRDQDQCQVLIIPYRTDLTYLANDRYTAQLGLELSRYTSDPDVLREAMNVHSRKSFGTFLGGVGGQRMPKLYLDSPPDIQQPGSMTFELRGPRLVVAMNILTNLGKYKLSEFDLDISALREDLAAYFYGLEKYLSLLLVSLGAKSIAAPASPNLNNQPEGFTPTQSQTVRLMTFTE